MVRTIPVEAQTPFRVQGLCSNPARDIASFRDGWAKGTIFMSGGLCLFVMMSSGCLKREATGN